MIFAFLSAGSPAWLLGFGVGVAAGLVWVFLRRRKPVTPNFACGLSGDTMAEKEATQQHDPQDRGQHVIRLSPSSGPANATEMTQQQRIAAALRRAGFEGSVGSERRAGANHSTSENESATPRNN